MSRRPDRTWSIALCVAVAIHVGAALGTIESHNYSMRSRLADGTLYPRLHITPFDEDAVLSELAELERPWKLFGEHDGTGEATHRADGAEPLAGLLGDQYQPLLSRDPIGPGDIGNLPSAELRPQGDFGDGGDGQGGRQGQRLLPTAAASAKAEPVLFGPPQTIADRLPAIPKRSPPVEVAMLPDQQPPVQPAPPSVPVPPSGAPDSGGNAGRPGADRPPADPAPMSDSEVDAFTKNKGAIIIRAGQIEARLGRKVKTVRPRLNLASIGSILSLREPSLRLAIRFDETGKVQHVTVMDSSGSNELDQPTVVAMYEWWFEPLRDESGNPQGDIVVLSINFR